MPTNLDRRLADYDPYIERAATARHKALIQNFRDHNEFEQTGQVDRLLALYADDAEFHVYGGVFGQSRETHIKGLPAIRERYENMWTNFVSKSADPPSRLDHLMVTDWGLSGIITGENVTTGAVLAESGFTVADVDATYTQSQKVAFFREYRGDLAVGMTYFTSAPTITPVGDAA